KQRSAGVRRRNFVRNRFTSTAFGGIWDRYPSQLQLARQTQRSFLRERLAWRCAVPSIQSSRRSRVADERSQDESPHASTPAGRAAPLRSPPNASPRLYQTGKEMSKRRRRDPPWPLALPAPTTPSLAPEVIVPRMLHEICSR